MQIPRTIKLTLALSFTLAIASLMLFWTFETFKENPQGQRLRVIRQMERKTNPLWPEMTRIFKENTPPNSLPLPKGNNLSTLRKMAGYALVRKAFYVSPEKILTVIEKRKGGNEEYRVDLRTWHSTTTVWDNLWYVGEMRKAYKQHSKSFLESQRRVFERQAFEWNVMDYMRHYAWDSPSFFSIRSLAPQPLTPEDNPFLYLKGDTYRGFLGYVLDDWKFCRMGDPVIDNKHLDLDVHWQSYADIKDQVALSPPAKMPPELGFLVLSPNPIAVRVNSLQAEMEYWIGFGLLGILGMFGILASVRQANQMLREVAVFRAKTDFVSGVSHEMRTPLTTIKLYAEMLSQDLIPEVEKKKDYLNTIIGEADRLTRLIENVLDYAKISGRRREYRMERIEVSSAIEEAIVSLKGAIEQNGVFIETSFFPSEILADRDSLVQSLVNLIGNAIKYAGGRILVQIREEERETAISVRDWGPGIPLKEQRKIFQPFYRIGNELTRTASGSGLGLSLVREYAKAHGGRIELNSRFGEGSTFRLVLPKGKKA